MKDENDKQTLELAMPAPSAREIALGKLKMDRAYRAREGLIIYLPVSLVAKEWSVTPRRVRALLCSGRLDGRQGENGYWEVAYPYTMTEGRRGPQMRKYAPRKVELRAV